jgi:hypothetical protein
MAFEYGGELSFGTVMIQPFSCYCFVVPHRLSVVTLNFLINIIIRISGCGGKTRNSLGVAIDAVEVCLSQPRWYAPTGLLFFSSSGYTLSIRVRAQRASAIVVTIVSRLQRKFWPFLLYLKSLPNFVRNQKTPLCWVQYRDFPSTPLGFLKTRKW